jgi:hypothetical protein
LKEFTTSIRSGESALDISPSAARRRYRSYQRHRDRSGGADLINATERIFAKNDDLEFVSSLEN